MTPQRTIEAFEACTAAILEEHWSATSKELSEEAKGKGRPCDSELANHLLFMCETGKQFVRDGRTEKAMRWLGFVQGTIWAVGIASIDTMKHWNMPK